MTEGFLSLLWNALGDFTLRILILCAIVSIIVEMVMARTSTMREIGWIDGFSIMLAVVLSSSVQAANDYQKEKQFQHLNTITDEKKTVFIINLTLICHFLLAICMERRSNPHTSSKPTAFWRYCENY